MAYTATFDTRRAIMVNGEAYRKYGLAQRPAPNTSLTHALVSGVAMAAFVVAIVVWLS